MVTPVPAIKKEVKQFVKACLGFMAVVGTNRELSMTQRLTPEGVWSQFSLDFKDSVDGKYYLHTVQGNLSRLPEIHIILILHITVQVTL